MKKSTQQVRFKENFQNYSTDFGNDFTEFDLDFLFFVEIVLDLPSQKIMQDFTDFFQKKLPKSTRWVSPDKMGITLALPGRMGTHFQGNHVAFMEDKIQNILSDIKTFSIELGDLNCFKNSLFREVVDSTGTLQNLHDKLSQSIPFSQNPDFQYEKFLPHISVLHLNQKNSHFFPENFDRNYKVESLIVSSLNFGKVVDHDGRIEKIVLKNFDLPSLD